MRELDDGPRGGTGRCGPCAAIVPAISESSRAMRPTRSSQVTSPTMSPFLLPTSSRRRPCLLISLTATRTGRSSWITIVSRSVIEPIGALFASRPPRIVRSATSRSVTMPAKRPCSFTSRQPIDCSAICDAAVWIEALASTLASLPPDIVANCHEDSLFRAASCPCVSPTHREATRMPQSVEAVEARAATERRKPDTCATSCHDRPGSPSLS